MMADCPFLPLSEDYQPWIATALILFGLASTISNIYLVYSLIYGKLYSTLSQINLLLLVATALTNIGRTLLAGFPFSATTLFFGMWLFGTKCCKLFAMLSQFFFISQFFINALLAYEQVSKFNKSFLGHILCSFSIALFLSLAQCDSYICDITGTNCDIDWRISNIRDNLLFSIFGVIIPLTITVLFLVRSRKFYPRDNQQTKLVMELIVCFNLVYLPKFLFNLWMVLFLRTNTRIEINPKITTFVVTVQQFSNLVLPLLLFSYDYFNRRYFIQLT